MSISTLLVVMLIMVTLAFWLGRARSLRTASTIGPGTRLNSLPFYYGTLTALWCGIPSLVLLCLWVIFDDAIIASRVVAQLPAHIQALPQSELGLVLNQITNVAQNVVSSTQPQAYLVQGAEHLLALRQQSQRLLSTLIIAVAVLFCAFAWFRIHPELRARNQVETTFKTVLLLCASLAVFTTVGIVLSVLFESLRFFQSVPVTEFLFGLEWSPQMAIRDDQVGGSGAFGAVPLFVGTMLISLIAMIVAVPAGLMAAIYLSEYARPGVRSLVKPLLEVLAGIPTVVYGFFAALTVAPFIRDSGSLVGLDVSSESALAAGLVMGVMIIPFVSSLSDDVINAVPQSLRDGSLGLGATQSETIKQVVIPAALPGIVGGVLLAVSRAIGETMIVVMAAGLAANLTANPLESVTTVTVQIVTLLVGDQEFNSPKTLSAFALGLMLFVITLALNYVALHVVKKYREQYD